MMTQINPTHSFNYEGTRVNVYHANKGEGLQKHVHSFAHATMCTSGSCLIKKENKQVVINKNSQPVNLVANQWHEIVATEDNTVFVNIFVEPTTIEE
jgi:quercetin dioxygenase-like cupin family protein